MADRRNELLDAILDSWDRNNTILIKLILKQNGQAIDDEVAGDVTWDVWMDKAADRERLSEARRTPKPQADRASRS